MADSGIALEPGLANQVLKAITDIAKRQELNGQPAVLLVPDALRDFLSRFVRQSISNIHVLAYSEIPENRQVKIVATVSGNNFAA